MAHFALVLDVYKSADKLIKGHNEEAAGREL